MDDSKKIAHENDIKRYVFLCFSMFFFLIVFSRIPEWWLANLANASWAPMPIASNVRESQSPGAKAGMFEPLSVG